MPGSYAGSHSKGIGLLQLLHFIQLGLRVELQCRRKSFAETKHQVGPPGCLSWRNAAYQQIPQQSSHPKGEWSQRPVQQLGNGQQPPDCLHQHTQRTRQPSGALRQSKRVAQAQAALQRTKMSLKINGR